LRNNVKLLSLFITIVLLTILSTAHAQSPVPSGATLEVIATGIQQPEGPVWKDGVGLLFSDIKAAKIYKWTSENGLEVFMAHSDSSNGLTLDLQGRLILTQMGKRRIARQETDNSITPLVSTYNGKKFNSPNDLVVKSDGSIFFTDPDFNIPGGSKNKQLSFQGIYRIGNAGNLKLLDSSFVEPNGICFSPDEKKLYVNESPTGQIFVWDVINDSTITNKKLFYMIPSFGYADGMKVDPEGNLYCTGPTGVWIISPTGKLLDKIILPGNQSASNCAWGDDDKKTLYITSGSSTFVYKIRLDNTSDVEEKNEEEEDQGSVLPKSMELQQNYPNPFNPETVIEYSIANIGRNDTVPVQLRVYDMLGKEIATLVDEEQSPGVYKAHFDVSQLSGLQSKKTSGVYFYRLVAGDFVAVKKMVLMK
jgi:gluconolactonase